jgi:hypothetical protein
MCTNKEFDVFYKKLVKTIEKKSHIFMPKLIKDNTTKQYLYKMYVGELSARKSCMIIVTLWIAEKDEKYKSIVINQLICNIFESTSLEKI